MYIKTGSGSGATSSNWKNVAQMYIKTSASVWERIRQGYIKTGSGSGSIATNWKRFFYEANLPTVTTYPEIRSANTSGTGGIYDGDEADSPQFLNADLFGKDGTYANYTSIPAASRRFSYADNLDDTTRTTLVNDDRFSSAGGVTTTTRSNLDGKYLFYEVQVNNGTGDDFINPVSNAIKMIKSYPALTSFGWTGAEAIGTMLTFDYNIENYYYNKIDPGLSYVRWWRSSTTGAGGTLLKEETITATTTGTPSSTQRLGTSYYTPVAADNGYYIVAEITARSSYTDHNGYTDNYQLGSFPTNGVIGSALGVSGVSFTDSNGRSGKNARGNLVTATTTTLNWTVTGVNTGTTFRVRYRVKNNQNGLYYNPNDPSTSLAAGSAWLEYTKTYNGTGGISGISISGSTATLYDTFTIDSAFNGSTYAIGSTGGFARWTFQYEISVVSSSGTRYYWVYPNSVSTTQAHDYWDIDPTTNPSISASPSTIAPGGTVTFSGTFNSYPASLSSYPHSYRIVYGTSPATDSGWITLGSGTANQTYTNTKVYSTAGTYSAYIETTPYYTLTYATVTVSDVKVPPTIGTPTLSALGEFVAGQRRVSVPFTAVTNSGPAYQIYWWSYATAPVVGITPDGSRTISPVIDESGPTTIGRNYAYIRSSATTSTTGTTAPSTTLSEWSAGVAFYVDGDRTLSYNKNTTDTVTSLPSSSTGTDPWDGWVTTVSANTPARTGFTFNGYNTSADGTGTNYAASAAITLTSAVTLYVKWTANTYAVTYYGNSNTGGSVPDAQTKTYGVSLTLRTNVNTLTRTNYAFNGWNTNSDGTGTSYSAGGAYTGNAALDLYAKWAALYTITFDSKGGTAVSSIEQSSSGGSIAKPSDPTKTDYTFGGWTTTDGGTTVVTWPKTPTGNETLYAKWTSTAVAPSAPAKPTVGTLSYSHDSADLATTLTRVSNTAKTQAWTYTAEVGFPVTWVKPSGATDFEIYTNSTGTAPSDSTSGNSTTSTGNVTTYTYWTTQSNRGTITRYFWVKAKNSTGSSGWSPVSTAKTSVATVVSGLALLLYRGNGTGTPSSPASAPAATALSYPWVGLQNRGNPNGTPVGEGHYATVDTLTIAGTSDYATSDTV